MNKKYRRGAHKATIRICLCLKNCSTFRLFASLSLQMQRYFRSSLLFSGWEKKEATTGNTSVFVDYSPLFFRKIVEIERFALRAAIFVSNAPSQTWGVVSNLVRVQGTVWEEFPALIALSDTVKVNDDSRLYCMYVCVMCLQIESNYFVYGRRKVSQYKLDSKVSINYKERDCLVQSPKIVWKL